MQPDWIGAQTRMASANALSNLYSNLARSQIMDRASQRETLAEQARAELERERLNKSLELMREQLQQQANLANQQFGLEQEKLRGGLGLDRDKLEMLKALQERGLGLKERTLDFQREQAANKFNLIGKLLRDNLAMQQLGSMQGLFASKYATPELIESYGQILGMTPQAISPFAEALQKVKQKAAVEQRYFNNPPQLKSLEQIYQENKPVEGWFETPLGRLVKTLQPYADDSEKLQYEMAKMAGVDLSDPHVIQYLNQNPMAKQQLMDTLQQMKAALLTPSSGIMPDWYYTGNWSDPDKFAQNLRDFNYIRNALINGGR